MSESSSSLYIHVPFCRKKCAYCDFFSLGSNNCADFYTLREHFVSSLMKEVYFYAHVNGISKWKTVYVGGGTPSQLTLPQVSALFKGIFTVCPPAEDAEVTMEVNPEDVTEELIDVLKNAGVNRISMGIQAFDQKALQAVSRTASARMALQALQRLRRHWKGRLSCDMIAGLPCHTYASFEEGIHTLCSYENVDHISLYTLTIEEGTPLALSIDSGATAWSQEKADRMWIRGRNLLEKYGYMQYEVSNFSKAGCRSRHNTVYWKLQDYIGCGPGASGTIYGKMAADKSLGDGIRWTNTTDVAAYNHFWQRQDEKSPACLTLADLPCSIEVLDADTQEFEYLMMGFRMLDGVSEEDYAARFGKSLAKRLGAEGGIFYDWKKRRLARQERGRFSLTEKGLMLLNPFLEALV